jgi:tetratricopeptide (TPR) repeat protein
MRTPFSRARVTLAVLIVASVAANAAAQTGRVVGIVKDETGQPIKGATLSLENPDASPRNFTATSDDHGRFAVIGLKAGEWSLVAQAPGFQAEVARLQVRATTPSAPALTMKRAPQAPPSALGNVGVKDLQSELRSADEQFNAQQWDQAIASYKSILAKAPALSAVNLQVGAAYRNKKEYDNAIAAYNDLLKADPTSDKARVGVGQAYMEKGDLAAAANVLSQGTSKEAFYTLGQIESARGNGDAASQWYQKAATEDPNWGKPLLQLGLTSLKKGDKADAAAKMQRVIAVDPTSAEAVQAKTVMEQIK